MSDFLPEIRDGKIVEEPEEKLYAPPKLYKKSTFEEELTEAQLNNLKRKRLTKDFSDSPHLEN